MFSEYYNIPKIAASQLLKISLDGFPVGLRDVADCNEKRLGTPYILHTSDLQEKDGITFLPVYMAGLL